jgi:hypothetical protein
MEKVNGIVKFVAKTGGLKLEGSEEWYNPVNELKNQVNLNLKNQAVELSLDEKKKITSIKLINEPIPQEDYEMVKKESHSDRKELLMIRQTCIKAAAEIAAGQGNNWKNYADDMESWILRQ